MHCNCVSFLKICLFIAGYTVCTFVGYFFSSQLSYNAWCETKHRTSFVKKKFEEERNVKEEKHLCAPPERSPGAVEALHMEIQHSCSKGTI
jgi:hypothetical protein